MNRRGLNSGVYRDIPYESNEELWFLMWAFELKEIGYIENIERAESFKLTDSLVREYTKIIRKRVVIRQEVLLNGSSYTPEFKIKWKLLEANKMLNHVDASPIVYKPNSLLILTKNTISYIEVKANFDNNNMTRIFQQHTQKQMWDKHNIYVNLIKIPSLFKETFTPKEYLITPKTKQVKKVNFEIRTVEQYLESLKSK